MTDAIANSAAARRIAALAILAFLLWLVAPLVLTPFAGFAERAEAIETETALLDRLGRMEARRASIASLAGVAGPPFLVAADAAAATQALQAHLSGLVAPETLRIESLSPLPREDRPGAPVEVSMTFSATESAFYAFLSRLETQPPFVRVRELSVKSTLEGSVRVIAGHAVVSAVPHLTGQP